MGKLKNYNRLIELEKNNVNSNDSEYVKLRYEPEFIHHNGKRIVRLGYSFVNIDEITSISDIENKSFFVYWDWGVIKVDGYFGESDDDYLENIHRIKLSVLSMWMSDVVTYECPTDTLE